MFMERVILWFRFGGGPAVNHLYVCAICQVEIEALAKRRKTEIETFIKVRTLIWIQKGWMHAED